MSRANETCRTDATLPEIEAPRLVDPRARLLSRLLPSIRAGRLRIELPNGQTIYRTGAEEGPEASLVLHRWRALWRLATGGDVGFAEAYIDGDWSADDLTAVVRIAARNLDDIAKATSGSWLVRMFNRALHRANANTRSGSRRNIVAHYDLGNAFYARWLDESMLYSSAIFNETTRDLAAAQALKLRRIRALLGYQPGASILEIGFGWGALAAHLASDGKTRVTGLTLSPSQLEWARGVIEQRRLQDRVDLRIEDYRDVTGSFDRVVSIEMLEAVGVDYWPSYFEKIAAVMKPGGRAVLQVITIADEREASYRRAPDFIQKHVFPGGVLPSPSSMQRAVMGAGLQIAHAETFGASYALTLAAWRRRFHADRDEIAKQGFDERFLRLWDYYLCYCEAGFLEGVVDVGLYVITHRKPGDATPG
ncbi:MAG: class I SAM-dependent methyltransferase [Hyphomicrobiaceae bacterium]